MNKLNICKKM